MIDRVFLLRNKYFNTVIIHCKLIFGSWKCRGVSGWLIQHYSLSLTINFICLNQEWSRHISYHLAIILPFLTFSLWWQNINSSVFFCHWASEKNGDESGRCEHFFQHTFTLISIACKDQGTTMGKGKIYSYNLVIFECNSLNDNCNRDDLLCLFLHCFCCKIVSIDLCCSIIFRDFFLWYFNLILISSHQHTKTVSSNTTTIISWDGLMLSRAYVDFYGHR